MRVVGKETQRVDAWGKVSGEAKYSADLNTSAETGGPSWGNH